MTFKCAMGALIKNFWNFVEIFKTIKRLKTFLETKLIS